MVLGLNISKILAPAFLVLGAMLGLTILAGFLGGYFDGVATITGEFESADTGNAQANTIVQSFGFVVPVVLVLGLLGLVIAVGVIAYKNKN